MPFRTQWLSASQIIGAALLAAFVTAPEPAQAQDAPAARIATTATIYLYGEADLEKLRRANPDHYARAQLVIADSETLCKPGKDEIEYVKYDAKAVSCASMLIKTSNPPKRELGFTLDDVRYVAVITLKDAAPQFRHVPLDGAEK